MSNYKHPVCRGSFALGTACGLCERCEEIKNLGRPGSIVIGGIDDKGRPLMNPDLSVLEKAVEALRLGFMTSVSNGHPDPLERSYRLQFSFSDLESLHAAHAAMVAALTR